MGTIVKINRANTILFPGTVTVDIRSGEGSVGVLRNHVPQVTAELIVEEIGIARLATGAEIRARTAREASQTAQQLEAQRQALVASPRGRCEFLEAQQ